MPLYTGSVNEPTQSLSMTVQYKTSIGLVALLTIMLMPRPSPAQTPAEIPVLLRKTVTIVDYEPPKLRIDVSGDPSDYYAQIDMTDSTLIFASPDEQAEFDEQRPKLERNYERSRPSKTAGKQPPYRQPYLGGRNLLRPGIAVSIRFLEYRYSRRFAMQSVTILTDQADDGRLRGPLEQVTGDVGLVNGQRIRLKPKVVLVGVQGYAGLSFPGFGRLEEGVEVTVQGKRQADGVLLAESATVTPDELTPLDQQLNESLKTTRQLSADSTRVTFGAMSYPLLTDKLLTSYLTALVLKLMPARFRDLPTDHPAALNARVYVVADSTANACAYPDGSVYVHTGLLTLVENEAQLAAVLSREWAHVTFHHPRQSYQAASTTATSGTALSPTLVAACGLEPTELATYVTAFGGGPLSSSYKQEFESQADRLGLKYMMLAGYDPREMTKVWGKLYRKSPDRPVVPFASRTRTPTKNTRLFESPYDTHGLAGRRQKYVNSLLLSDYQNTDLTKFSTGILRYKPIREQVIRLLTPPTVSVLPNSPAVVMPPHRPRSRSRSPEPQTPAQTVRRPRPATSGPARETP